MHNRRAIVVGYSPTQSDAWSQAADLTGHADAHSFSGCSNTWTLGNSKVHRLVPEAGSNATRGHVASVDETTSYGAVNNLNQYLTVTQVASPSVTLTHADSALPRKFRNFDAPFCIFDLHSCRKECGQESAHARSSRGRLSEDLLDCPAPSRGATFRLTRR